MKETNISQLIRLEAHKYGLTLWRNNNGALKDSNGRLVTYGLCKGSSDLIGIRHGDGRFIAIEVKAQGKKPRPEQQNFIDFINKNGGFAFYCDSLEDFRKKILTLK